ncbi:MAG TPA: secondary thiamine-phosphate synthase enzyme YjbQ [Tepidisphaeraceae bacterium]
MVQGYPPQVEKLRTTSRNQMIDITDRVQERIKRDKVRTGLAIVFVSHTTAGITINENADTDVKHDLLAKLEALIPKNESYYRHGEGNSDSHLKASMMGSSVTLLIEHGKLQLGTWQGVYFCEFDGPRERQVLIKLVNLDPRGETD